MIMFGPSGNSEQFYEEGHKHTYEAMAWIKGMGLNAYEYSFGRGVRIGEQTANIVRQEAGKNAIAMSVHAPYFINLATEDEQKRQKNLQYFLDSARAAKWLGADRVIFHPGSCAKLERSAAFHMAKNTFSWILKQLDEAGHGDLTYCPETMGKINQLGDLQEIIQLVRLDDRVIPTIDFGHLHARGRGAINSPEDFEAILKALIDGIGYERTKNMHVHFSTIEYTAMGERQHRTFADEGFGPYFEQLAPMLLKYELEPRIICETKGTMAKDALAMKQMYEKAKREKER